MHATCGWVNLELPAFYAYFLVKKSFMNYLDHTIINIGLTSITRIKLLRNGCNPELKCGFSSSLYGGYKHTFAVTVSGKPTFAEFRITKFVPQDYLQEVLPIPE